jgi:hypothetical protein
MVQVPGALGLTPAQVERLLMTAGRAPSLHNSQPWRFRVTPQTIEIHADPQRRVPVADPDGRELRMACGAALFNLRLALHECRIRPIVTLFPDRAQPGLLAVVRHGGAKEPTPEQSDLLRAVPAWRTNRHPFSDVPVNAPELQSLRRAALDEGAWLHVVQDPAQRASLRAIAATAHRLQTADPAFRAELRAWSHALPDRRDGVPARAGGSLPETQDRWVLRDYTGGTGQVRIPGKDFESEPVIAVLSSHLSGPMAEFQVGQALQRVLLTATVNGLSVSFLSHVVETARTREQVRHLIGGSRPPQAVLRLGHGWPVVATPRREVADLVAPDRTAST